jgi:DNA-binding IclR family transcriptional regulator
MARRTPPDTIRIGKNLPDERHAVKSAGRVLAILEFFDDIRRGATITELASSLGFPLSSVSYLMQTLVSRGYAAYDPGSRKYVPTDRVAVLGSWLTSPLIADGIVISAMKELHRDTGLSVLLATRNGQHAQYIHIIQSIEPDWTPIALGAARPLPSCCAGFAILSTMSEAEVRTITRRVNAYAEPDTPIVKIPLLLEDLDQVRRDGFAYTHDLVTAGGSCIAVPLPRIGDQPPLAICLASRATAAWDEARAKAFYARDLIGLRLGDLNRVSSIDMIEGV